MMSPPTRKVLSNSCIIIEEYIMKCVSGCKGLETDICSKSTRCAYASGTRRKYCRLSSAFKMRKTDCKVTRKLKKKEQVEQSGKRIHQFMKATKTKRVSEFLKAVCSDSGICVAVGTNRNKILDFFSGFTNFEYATPPIKAIGNPSSNGFVKEIRYERNGYVSHAVLKSSTRTSSDNLAYEYIVGQYLNKQGKLFPCFLETYGLFYYKDDAAWKHSMETKSITTNILKDALILQPETTDYKKMCAQSKYAAILIQHLNGVNTLGDVFGYGKEYKEWFVARELLQVLYQVYFPLAQMAGKFTHYDLHDGNVLLYEPVKGKYIQYHYHINGEIVNFKSRYMVKIIDYGRCYYEQDKQNSSTDVHNKLCKEPMCNPCGDNSGFQYMNTYGVLKENYYICSAIVNPSHDLRLLSILKKRVDGINIPAGVAADMYAPLDYLLKNTVYGAGLTRKQQMAHYVYGTKPNMTSGFTKKKTKVNNVVDAERLLRDMIPFANQWNETCYKSKTKLGDIHVYSDGTTPMKFTPA